MNKKILDLAERAGKTFAQVFLATYAPVLLGAGSLGGVLNLSVADKAATAAVAAVFSVVMSAMSFNVGDKNSASALPKE